MRRRTPGWTLLYLSKSKGDRRPLAQVHLSDQTDAGHLREEVLPDLLEKMSRRPAGWRLILACALEDEVDTLDIWRDEPAAARLLEAAHAWAIACQRAGLSRDAAMRLFHAHTLEDICQCLLLRATTPDTDSLDAAELHSALDQWALDGTRPARLRGCR